MDNEIRFNHDETVQKFGLRLLVAEYYTRKTNGENLGLLADWLFTRGVRISERDETVCYVPNCIRPAVMNTTGGKMCKQCYCKMMIATIRGESYYRPDQQLTRDDEESIALYEKELKELGE